MRLRDMSLRTVRRLLVTAVVLALLVVTVPLAVTWLQDAWTRCWDGVVKQGEGSTRECVGVTDGSRAFADHLEPVTELIKKENDRVLKETESGDEGAETYVSVAYMTTFTITHDDTNSEESVRRELQGAYLAQYQHNRTEAAPKIRLLIANMGSSARHWKHTVDELIARKKTSDHLVAVTGLGPSTKRTRAALHELSDAGLATVASNMTATNISPREDPVRGFARIAPTNTDEAKAAAAYLHRQKVRTTAVVEDVADGNLYAHTLSDAFTREFPKGGGGRRMVTDSPMTYDSSVAGAWRNELFFMTSELCDYRPQVVYFAGRGRHLTHFLDELANRTCQEDWDFTVMTGDDTTNLTQRQLKEATSSGIEVLYTGLAHPDVGRKDPDAVNEYAVREFEAGQKMDRWFPHDPVDDGSAIMAHDAVRTAAQGIRMAANEESTGRPSGDAVGRMFQQMNGHRVGGASGFLSFQPNGDPRNKAVPILRLHPNGVSELVDVSSPSGTPTTAG